MTQKGRPVGYWLLDQSVFTFPQFISATLVADNALVGNRLKIAHATTETLFMVWYG